MPTISPVVTPYYGGGQVKNPADVLQLTAVPSTADIAHNVGTLAVNTSSGIMYGLVQKTAGVATWAILGGATGALATLTGDTGTATPSAGNIQIAGTANQITTTGSGAAVTLSLPSAITTPGSLTATTSLTATAGNITATLGNVVINGAAKQLQVHGGAVTDFIGTATLVSGTVTIANTNIAATDRIFIQRTAANASTTLGEISYTISAATSFTITSLILGTPGSTQTGDASTVTYFIVRQV